VSWNNNNNPICKAFKASASEALHGGRSVVGVTQKPYGKSTNTAYARTRWLKKVNPLYI